MKEVTVYEWWLTMIESLKTIFKVLSTNQSKLKIKMKRFAAAIVALMVFGSVVTIISRNQADTKHVAVTNPISKDA